jgi:hypothetical protein
MPALVFPDNTVLCNFGAVGRLDLLRDWLRGRGRWVEAVAYEASRSADHIRGLGLIGREGWLGEPIEISDPAAVERVESIRRFALGGSAACPLQHLGEAQTCYLLAEDPVYAGSWWVSDDEDAYDYACRRGIQAYRTIDIMKALVADGDLTSRQAFDLMAAMEACERCLEMPSSPQDLE